MQDNSQNKKKTLLVSVLAFLFVGGGVFLFFIIQGSNELTGAGKSNFHYGEAAREGVSSFFKSIGIVPDESGELAKKKEERMAARGFTADGEKAAADVSDWMSNNGPATASASASPSRGGSAAVPKMSGTGGSGVGGSSGGTKSNGGTSRFGEGNTAGNTTVSAKSQAAAGAPAGKGTLGALRNARAMLGEGLSSNSAMTARGKWGQSFGVGGAGGKSTGDLAYNKSGLVNLDKIKSGQIASLKPAPETGAFERDKEGEKKDAGIKAAQDAASAKSKADAEMEAKKAALQAAADGVAKGMESGAKPAAGPSGAPDPGRAPITDAEKDEARSLAFFDKTPLGGGASFKDDKVDIQRTPDGGAEYTISGTQSPTPPATEPVAYKDVVIRGPDGKLTFK